MATLKRLPLALATVAAVGAVGLTGAVAASSGAKLAVTSDTLIPASNPHNLLVIGEAADGAVYAAVPTTAGTDAIEVLNGAHPARVVTHVSPGTVGIAATKSDFFVAGRSAISSFSPKTGRLRRTWDVRVASLFGAAGNMMVAGDGRLWVVGNAGQGRHVIEINPGSASIRQIGSGVNVFSLAVGSRGVYFVRSGGQSVIRVGVGGHHKSAPSHEKVNLKLSGAAALQAQAVVGGHLLVSHAAGQGLDATLVRYDARTLAHLGWAGTDLAHSAVVSTANGPLVLLATSDTGGCPNPAVHACVAQIVPATAKTVQTVKLPSGAVLSPLVGPKPAIVVARGGHAHLVRLGG
jgi:hypothetical protein